jgi:metallo-beta-lactamase class B
MNLQCQFRWWVQVQPGIARAVCGAAMVIAASALQPATVAAQVPANWTDTIAPFHVIDNVYYVGSAGLSAWLITTPEGHILLDAGMPSYAPTVERNIQTLGFALKDVKILLNTHAHFDHSGGLARLKQSTGAKLIAHSGDRAALESGLYIGSESVEAYRFPAVTVDSVIGDRDRVTLGGVTLTANHTPGHTAGCTSWTMPVVDNGVRHRAVFFCSASVAANRLAPNPQYPGIVADYRRTFQRLKMMRADVFFAPHAELFDLQAKRSRMSAAARNPFIEAGRLRRLAVELERDFEEALGKQRGAGR